MFRSTIYQSSICAETVADRHGFYCSFINLYTSIGSYFKNSSMHKFLILKKNRDSSSIFIYNKDFTLVLHVIIIILCSNKRSLQWWYLRIWDNLDYFTFYLCRTRLFGFILQKLTVALK